MPLTPFHLGPALFLGLMFFRVIHLPAFLAANVIVDVEPFLVLVLGLDYPLHGFLHSFLGGSIVAVILSLVMIRLDDVIQKIMSFFRLRQKHSKKNIVVTSFTGVYLHILLDSFMYTDITPLYPLTVNPFYNVFTGMQVYGFCMISFILGFMLYGYRIVQKNHSI